MSTIVIEHQVSFVKYLDDADLSDDSDEEEDEDEGEEEGGEDNDMEDQTIVQSMHTLICHFFSLVDLFSTNTKLALIHQCIHTRYRSDALKNPSEYKHPQGVKLY